MKQLLISFSVAIIGFLVLTQDIQQVYSKAVHSVVNATNATTNGSSVTAQNLSHVLELIQGLSHQLEVLSLNQTNNSTGPAQNATQNSTRVFHKAPLVNQTQLAPLNGSNSSVPSMNLSQAFEQIQILTHQLEVLSLNQTNNSTGPAQNGTQNSTRVFHKAPLVNQTILAPLNGSNSSIPSQNLSHIVEQIQLLNQTILAPLNGSNSSIPSQNLSHVIEQVLLLSHQLEVLSLNQTNNSTGPALNATQNSTRVFHKAPLVNQTILAPLNGSNSSIPSQNLSHVIEQIQLLNQTILTPLNGSNSSIPSQNLSHVIEQVLLLSHQLEVLSLNQTNNSTGPAQNGTQNSTRILHHAPLVNQTHLVPLNGSLNSSLPSGNSSLVPQLNVTQLYLLTLKNSQRIDALTQNVSRLANLIFQSSNSSQNVSSNSSRVIHFPVVAPIHLSPLNQTLNGTQGTSNSTRIVHQAPVVVALNSTAVNATTQIHALNQTQVILANNNLTHLQQLIGNLTHQIEQIKLH